MFCPKEMKKYMHKKTCTKIFTTALFKTVKSWKEPNYPSTKGKMDKLWYWTITDIDCNMDEVHRYDAEWKKLDSKHYIQYESIHRSSEAKLKLNKMQKCGFLSEEANHLGVTFWGGGSIPCCERGML